MSAEEVRLTMPWGVVALKCWNSSKLHPILMVHGGRDNAATFDKLVPLLPQDHYYVCIDLPGHGLSDGLTPGLPPSFMHYVGVLMRVVWHFQWKSYSLLGHSLGAYLVLAFAEADVHSHQIQKVILMEGLFRNPLEKQLFFESFRNDMHWILKLDEQWHQRKPTSYQEMQKKVANGGYPKEAINSYLARFPAKTNSDYSESAHAVAFFTLRPPFTEEVMMYSSKQVRCPVLAIFAKESHITFFTDEYGTLMQLLDNLKKGNPLTRVVRIHGTHSVHISNPESVAGVITPFMNEVAESVKPQAKL